MLAIKRTCFSGGGNRERSGGGKLSRLSDVGDIRQPQRPHLVLFSIYAIHDKKGTSPNWARQEKDGGHALGGYTWISPRAFFSKGQGIGAGKDVVLIQNRRPRRNRPPIGRMGWFESGVMFGSPTCSSRADLGDLRELATCRKTGIRYAQSALVGQEAGF